MDVQLRKSDIHGVGVFARQPIEEGHWQWVYGYPTNVDNPLVDCWGINMDGGAYLAYEPWCYLNHDDDPNCCIWMEDEKNDSPRVFVQAICDIDRHSELTIDYGSEYFDSNDSAESVEIENSVFSGV